MVKKKNDKTKEEIEADMKAIEEAENFNLSDIEGIGPKKMQKLEDHGIRKPTDLIVKGSREISEILGIDLGASTKLVESARRFLQNKGITQKGRMTALDYMTYKSKTRYNLTTGVQEFDDMLKGGYRSGIITELYGLDGSGKTQCCMYASILAQLPYKKRCFKCKKEFEDQTVERCDECQVKTVRVGGLSDTGKPCSVVYVDTEGSFESDRVFEIILENELVPVKEQTKEEKRAGLPKEPLDEDALEQAKDFMRRITLLRPSDSAQQILYDEELGSIIEETGARLVIVDSLMGTFRLDYAGRGSLSDRQVALTPHIKHLARIANTFNVPVIVTNQVLQDPSAGPYMDPTKPIGGMIVGHTSKNRVYLRKGGSKDGERKIIAILKDSPYAVEDEVILKLTKKGIESGE